jgi:hypothetical protein
MAKNIISETVLNHKKSARWTEEEVILALFEMNIILKEKYSGCTANKHLVTFPSGETKSVRLRDIFNGVSLGKENYGGSTSKYTTETINLKLSVFGAILAEEYKGSIEKKHLISFSTGITKEVYLYSVLYGKSNGRMKIKHDTDTVNHALSKFNASLIEPFKGHVIEKHKILFGCGHIHSAKLSDAFYGHGCPICSKTGFNPSSKAFLYFVKIHYDLGCLYKIGITNGTIHKRYKSEGVTPEPLCLFTSPNGESVYQAEQELLKIFADHLFIGQSPFKFTSTTEIFSFDVSQDPRFFHTISKYSLIQISPEDYKEIKSQHAA